MPLDSYRANAHVIIVKLQQPHRYDFAMNCACGFTHHGFVADPKYNDELNDMKASARQHLANRHRIPLTEGDKFFEILPGDFAGGMSHDQLKLRLDVAKAKAAELQAAKEAEAKKTPPAPQP